MSLLLLNQIWAKKDEAEALEEEEYEDEIDEPEVKEALQADASVYGPLGVGQGYGSVGGYSGHGVGGLGEGYAKHSGKEIHLDHHHDGGYKDYSGYDANGGELGEKKSGVHEEHVDISDQGGHKKFVEDHGVHGEGVKKGGESFATEHKHGGHKEHSVGGEYYDKYGKDHKDIVNGASYQDGVVGSEKHGGTC